MWLTLNDTGLRSTQPPVQLKSAGCWQRAQRTQNGWWGRETTTDNSLGTGHSSTRGACSTAFLRQSPRRPQQATGTRTLSLLCPLPGNGSRYLWRMVDPPSKREGSHHWRHNWTRVAKGAERPGHKPRAFSPVPLTASPSVSGSALPPRPAVPLLMDFRKMTTGIGKWGRTGQIQPPSPCASADCLAACFLLTYTLEESVHQAHCVSAAQGEATSSKGSALHHGLCPSTARFRLTAL